MPALEQVTARPQRTTRIANAAAAFALVLFIVTAVLMRRDNAGAIFTHLDQIGTVVLGVIVAAGLRIPTRPRLVADLDGVRIRGYLGDFRVVPWEAIVAVEFPAALRFARLRLPGDESFAIYAIQRMDREYAVERMRGLRALFAATHPVAR